MLKVLYRRSADPEMDVSTVGMQRRGERGSDLGESERESECGLLKNTLMEFFAY